jgi:hypothetical protein
MKATRTIIAILFCALAITAGAQKNKNLLWDKVPTEFSVGGHATVSGVNAGGLDLGVDKNFPVSDVVALGFGGHLSAEYNKDFGCMTDLLASGNIVVGKSVGLELSGLVGAGQLSYEDISTNNAGSRAVYHNTAWRPAAGGELELFVKASKRVKFSAYVRGLHYFNSSSDRSYEEADGFSHEPTEYNLNKVAAGAKLTVSVGGATEKNNGKGRQVSGDNQWNATGFAGSSFGENQGFLLGAEFFHNHRFAANWQRTVGFGTQQTFGEGGNSFNEVFGKLGLLWEPLGAKSPVLFNIGIKAGGGEYLKGEQAATETGSYAMNSRVQVPGLVGKAYAGISIPFGAFRQLHFNAQVEAGGHTCFGTSFNGDAQYQGSTSGKGGFDAAWSVGLQWSF